MGLELKKKKKQGMGELFLGSQMGQGVVERRKSQQEAEKGEAEGKKLGRSPVNSR